MSARIKDSDPDPVYILRSGPQSVSSLTFSIFGDDNEEVLVSGSQNGLIQVWDLKLRRVKLKLEACDGKGILFADIIKLKQKQIIISHGRNGYVQFWNVDDGDRKLEKTMLVYEYSYCPIALHNEDGEYWLGYPSSGDSEITITRIDLDKVTNPVHMKPDNKLGMTMHIKLFSRHAQMIALVGYEDGSICLWDVLKCLLIDSKKIHGDPVMCLDVDRHSTKLISGSADNTLYVLQIDEDLKLQNCLSHNSASSGFACACIRDDGRIVACGGWDGKIRVFGWKKLKALAILKYHSEVVNKICFSRGNLIAAACKDGKITLWDVYKDS